MGFLGREESEPTPSAGDIMDGDLAPYAEIVADKLVELYREGIRRWYHREDFSVAQLQAEADSDQAATVKIFAAARDLATLIATHYPGVLSEDELAAKVPYDADILANEGRIVFDPEAPYPGPEAG